MTLDEQKRIIMGQLANYDLLLEKVAHIAHFFRPDPQFSDEACDWAMGEIAKEIKKEREQ